MVKLSVAFCVVGFVASATIVTELALDPAAIASCLHWYAPMIFVWMALSHVRAYRLRYVCPELRHVASIGSGAFWVMYGLVMTGILLSLKLSAVWLQVLVGIATITTLLIWLFVCLNMIWLSLDPVYLDEVLSATNRQSNDTDILPSA